MPAFPTHTHTLVYLKAGTSALPCSVSLLFSVLDYFNSLQIGLPPPNLSLPSHPSYRQYILQKSNHVITLMKSTLSFSIVYNRQVKIPIIASQGHHNVSPSTFPVSCFFSAASRLPSSQIQDIAYSSF